MPANPASLLRHLRRLATPAPCTADADTVLLGRFVRDRDEGAFAALVRRHGPMVRRVCGRVLADPCLADDACQATFLVLARRAAAVRSPGALAAWLHGVAYRVARKARAAGARRRLREVTAGGLDPLDRRPDPLAEVSARELLAVVDEEVRALPEAYRLPVILCCLEGKTQEEAARQLGWTPGSVKGRLERGRARLHARLVRRGLTLAAALAAVEVSRGAAAAGVPAALVGQTARAALSSAAGRGAVPQAALLAREVLREAALARVRVVAALLVLAGGLAAVGAGALAHERQAGAMPPAGDQPAAVPTAQDTDRPQADEAKQARADRYGDPLPEGALARLGTVRFRHGSGVTSVAFSPNGKTLASASWDHTICLWDPVTGKELRRLRGHSDAVMCVTYSADGGLLASGGNDGMIRLWDAATGRQLRSFQGHMGSTVCAVAFSADGTTLASGGGGNGHPTLALWDVATGKQLRRLGGTAYGVHCVTFSPDGRTLASGSDGLGRFGRPRQPGPAEPGGCAVRLWDVTTGKELRSLAGHGSGVTGVAFSPDGKRIASAGHDGTLRLWDPATGEPLRTLPVPGGPPSSQVVRGAVSGGVYAVAFSPDGKVIASGGFDGTVRLWDPGTGNEVRTLSGHGREVAGVAFAPDGKALASASYDHTVRVWDRATGEPLRPLQGHDGAVSAVTVSADGRLAASVGTDRTVRLWDPVAGQELRVLRGHTGPARGAAFSPDGRGLASGGEDGTVRIWDVATGKERRQLRCPEAWVLAVAYSPDGRLLASASLARDGMGGGSSVQLWDPATGAEVRTLYRGREAILWPLHFSADGRRLAARGIDKVRLWQVATGKELRGFDGGAWFAFSPGGRTLASGGREAAFRLWDLADGRELYQFGATDADLTTPFAFSPDGRVLARAGQGGATLLYEVVAGKERGRFEGHRGQVISLAFAPTGELLTGSMDTSVLIWDVNHPGSGHTGELSGQALEALWADLASADAGRAGRAIRALAAAPGQAVPLLRERLRPAQAVVAERVTRLLVDLDRDDFAARERAARELERLGELAAPALRAALAARPSPEVRRRAEALLRALDGPVTSADRLRGLRAVEVLEDSDSFTARQLLQELSSGAPEARLTQEAKASLERLAKRDSSKP